MALEASATRAVRLTVAQAVLPLLARGEVWLDVAPAEASSSPHVTAARAAYDELRAERQPVLHGPRTST